jgi:antitoxin (DNA-binding transcriptional repressor) of toxin-antitoxin stability system
VAFVPMHNEAMKTVTAGQFKKNCLKIIDGLSVSIEPIVITKKGKPIAKAVSADAKTSDDVFNCLRGVMKIVGDITGPAVPIEDWEVLRE